MKHLQKIEESNDYIIEKREIKTDKHAAFVIGFPESMYERLTSPTSWPPGIRFSDWFLARPRARRGSHSQSPPAQTNLSSIIEFLNHLECVLEKANEYSNDFIIVGDMNVNCIGEKTTDMKDLEVVLMAHDFRNEVTFPTRVTANSSTALDHVYCNGDEGTVRAAAVAAGVGDHHAVRVAVSRRGAPPRDSRRVRDYSAINRANFVLAVSSIDWEDLVLRSGGSAGILATCVNNNLSQKIDVCFPLRKKNGDKTRNSWVTEDILNIKSLLFESIALGRKFPDNEVLKEWIDRLHSKYDSAVAQCKARYYTMRIINAQNSCKTMWDIVNRERGKAGRPAADITEIAVDSNGRKYSSKQDVVNAINARFVGAAAACGAPAADLGRVRQVLAATRAPADRSMRLTPFTRDEVHRIISAKISHKPSKDVYNVSMELLNSVADTMSPILAVLYNACLREGIFPEALKASKISPLFKGKGKRENIDGYRPVSIVPATAKVFEYGLSSRLTEYLTSINALSDSQYAYRCGRSTTDLAREIVSRITNALEDRQQVAVLCCDLSKAFDVADHQILATKMEHYGIRGNAHNLLTDVLRGRSQIVVGDGGRIRSHPLTTAMGVPQGSSVSNILFSILLNDLPESVSAANILMYADDVAGIVAAPNVDCLENRLNDAANQLSRWFRLNGLALNLTKTHFIHFYLGSRTPRPLQVQAEGVVVEQVRFTNFLGFQIDSKLSWGSHIDKLCCALGSACFALRRLARVVPRYAVRSCYFATIHSLLQYGAELWGRAADYQRVFRLQKRAVRAVVGGFYNQPNKLPYRKIFLQEYSKN
ncbi:uncharacterized protein [Choristoneura fumiferana]|uniref:uncharacterized protein n=1 Tax=Choristoneura fumiferana TaxID=7141 RepID=UPI003D15A2F4